MLTAARSNSEDLYRPDQTIEYFFNHILIGPSKIMPSILVVASGVVAASYLFLVALLRLTQSTKEPPSICDTVPFFGPIFKMASKGVDFYSFAR
jgi:hypothetical protein